MVVSFFSLNTITNTTMYRPEDIKSNLAGLIGWRQDQDAEEIYESMQASSTGQYYQDFHPLLTLNNIKSVAPDYTNVSYTAWAAGTAYSIGDRVDNSDKTYDAVKESTGEEPTDNTEYWSEVDLFSEWLQDKTEGAVLKMMRSFWDNKLAANTASNVLEHKRFPSGTARLSETIGGEGNFVGFEITPIRSEGVTTRINKIGLQFSKAGDYTLYLLHSSQPESVKTITCTIAKDNALQWFSQTDLLLPYASANNGAGGSWYLAYDQNALPSESEAVNNTYDWSNQPCYSCNRGYAESLTVVSRYLEVSPFETNREDFTEAMPLWDIADNVYQPSRNYGISLELTLECDVTDLVIEQSTIFQNAIGLQVATDMLREFAYNPNFKIGREQQNLQRKEILYELDGFSDGRPSGVKYELKQAMKALELDVSKLSRVCMTCGKRGVRYRAT